MLGEQRDHAGLRERRVSLHRDGDEHARLIGVGEQDTFTRGEGVANGAQHDVGGFRKAALSGDFGAEVGKRAKREQQAPEVVGLHRHAHEAGEPPEHSEGNSRPATLECVWIRVSITEFGAGKMGDGHGAVKDWVIGRFETYDGGRRRGADQW